MKTHTPTQNQRVIIVGGGFAGTAAARALIGKLPAHVELVMVSEESYTTFNPMLPEAVGASIFPEQVVAPLRELLLQGRSSRFIMGRVTAVDTAGKQLWCNTLGGEMALTYDHLVLAFGNRARLDLLPGMAEHSLPLKTVGDALAIRNEVLRRLARIELETDATLRQSLGHFVIVGGGFSGVEVAGELVDCLRSIARYYPRVRAEELKVTVLHDGPRLLPELPEALGAAALKSLRKRQVEVRLKTQAAHIDAEGVALVDGTRCACRTVISTIGTQPNALVARLGLPLARGRIVVQPDLRVMGVDGHSGIWALGDCAAVPNALNGQDAPPTAQFAVREGKLLAHNLRAVLTNQTTLPFKYKAQGMMASIGHLKGVAQVFGLPISGLPAWMLWRAYYLSQMPTLGRKVRIFVEWTWGMFFPTDITHLRFRASAALLKSETSAHEADKPKPPP